MYMEVWNEGKAKREAKKDLVGLEVVKNDMKGLGLASADALDCCAWKWRICADPGLRGAHLGFFPG